MNVLPVIMRELQLRSRLRSTYWTRCSLGALAVMAATQEMLLSPNATNPNLVGQATFHAVSWLAFLLACSCALVTADALSRERREGTLGLLLLTNLRGYDVVMGKLCVSSLTASYALFGFLPALALIILAGGVSGGQFGRASLALLSGVFVFLCAGLWVSARSQLRGKAMRRSLAMVFLLCAVPRFAMYAFHWDPISCLSPLTAFTLSFDKVYVMNPVLFWVSLVATQVEAWGLLLWTGVYLSRNWQALESSPKPVAPEWRPVDEPQAEALAAITKTMLVKDPVCWVISRLKIQNPLMLGSILLLLGGTGFSWLTLMSGAGPRGATFGIWDGMHLFVSLGSAALLAWAAGRYLFEAQRNGELELLLTTPMGAGEIIGGNWRALCRPLRGAWLLVGFLMLIDLSYLHGSYDLLSIFLIVLKPVIRVLDIIALCWVGMYFGIKAQRSISAIGWAVGLVVGLPWLISFLFMVGTSILQNGSINRSFNPALAFFWSIAWPCLSLMKNIFFIQWAAGKLRTELRAKAVAWRSDDWLQ